MRKGEFAGGPLSHTNLMFSFVNLTSPGVDKVLLLSLLRSIGVQQCCLGNPLRPLTLADLTPSLEGLSLPVHMRAHGRHMERMECV